MFAGEATGEAVPSLMAALQRARSDLTLRSAVLALAVAAPVDDLKATDALFGIYDRVVAHPFLAPALLEALGLRALGSPVARSQLTTLLLRLGPDHQRYLLVKAEQVIGRVDAMRPEPDLRAKLTEFTAAPDLAVHAEARHQLALCSFADALLAGRSAELRDRLVAARAAFARAELSEEHRPDATVFVRLIDALLAFLDLGRDRAKAADGVTQLTGELVRLLGSPGPPGWQDYRSQRDDLIALRLLRIGDALHRAAEAATEAEEWVDFAASLEDLAKLYAQVRGAPGLDFREGRVAVALGATADVVYAASLGPLLAKVVQLRRLARIRADYVRDHGEDAVAHGLVALEQAAAVVAFAADQQLPEGVAGQVTQLAERAGREPDEFLHDLLAAVEQGQVAPWAEKHGFARSTLPIERLELYGEDPAVDEVVRPLLHQLAERLGDYPLTKWLRLVSVLVSLVKFAHYVRDRAPNYALCEEDGGLGQRASEGDLQADLFEWLRQGFGPAAVYELARSGGGRVDTGVWFSEARFPVEVKHEFVSVEPEHVRTSFVAQSDVYATASDRVSFLMVLDLRAGNAAGHRDRAKALRAAAGAPVPFALYHLRDGFRVESLPPDPQIPTATSKAVVIGLVPGNRPLPSSMSTYSRRPASARCKNKRSGQASSS